MASEAQNYEFLQSADLSEPHNDDDDDEYPEVHLDLSTDIDSLTGGLVNDFDRLAREVQAANVEQPNAVVGQKPALADDFIRNFFLQVGLTKSLQIFQNEWYDKQIARQLPSEDTEIVRDLQFRNQQLYDEIMNLEQELSMAKQVASQAISSLNQFKTERDYHRSNYKFVLDEKKELQNDLRRLKTHFESFEPTFMEMQHKYGVVMKEKMLLKIEKDRIADEIESMSSMSVTKNDVAIASVPQSTPEMVDSTGGAIVTNSDRNLTTWPREVVNRHLHAPYDALDFANMRVAKTFSKAHGDSIARMKYHPTVSAICTAGDDHVWKMWSLPRGDLMISGEGHRDWVSGIDVHPNGNCVVTSSGDSSVKLWDINQQKCTHTFSDHSQATWNVCFHDSGDFFASCSMDSFAKIYDAHALKIRRTIRGHLDSINYITFAPYSTTVATASADRTISLWDMRSGLSTATFYGHQSAVNHCVFSLQGGMISTCDASGKVKIWDSRMTKELMHVDCGTAPVNSSAFERCGRTLVIASGDGTVKMIDTQTQSLISSIDAHDEQVQDVAFDPHGKFMATCASDGSWKLWQ